MINIFGHLNKIEAFENLTYKYKGTIIRALKAGLAATVAILLTAATAGVLFPEEFSPLTVVVLTGLLQAIDKFLRENEIDKEFEKEIPITDTIPEDVMEDLRVE